MPNYQVIRWKKDWSIPHRLLLKRAIILSKQNDQHFDGHNDIDSICHYEWLVKWTGLGYDHVTWELDDASFMTSPKGMKLIDGYESRQKKPDGLTNPFEANEVLISTQLYTKNLLLLLMTMSSRSCNFQVLSLNLLVDHFWDVIYDVTNELPVIFNMPRKRERRQI